MKSPLKPQPEWEESPTAAPRSTDAAQAAAPAKQQAAMSVASSERYCRQLATSHYENFVVASVLLPAAMRAPFYSLYAYCRTADDLADESASPEAALSALDRLAQDLDKTFAGQPPQREFFPALHATIKQFAMTREPFDDLLSAMRQDQTVTQYESYPQLLDYCSRSASPVGRMVLQLADLREGIAVEQSDDICIGLQLANFWQDVARDHQIGRIYLPEQMRNEFQVTPDMLLQSSTAPELKSLLKHLCQDARERFQRGMLLVESLPRWLASDVRLMAQGGVATLDAIAKMDYDVLRCRPKVSRWKQSKLLMRAVLGRML